MLGRLYTIIDCRPLLYSYIVGVQKCFFFFIFWDSIRFSFVYCLTFFLPTQYWLKNITFFNKNKNKQNFQGFSVIQWIFQNFLRVREILWDLRIFKFSRIVRHHNYAYISSILKIYLNINHLSVSVKLRQAIIYRG